MHLSQNHLSAYNGFSNVFLFVCFNHLFFSQFYHYPRCQRLHFICRIYWLCPLSMAIQETLDNCMAARSWSSTGCLWKEESQRMSGYWVSDYTCMWLGMAGLCVSIKKSHWCFWTSWTGFRGTAIRPTLNKNSTLQKEKGRAPRERCISSYKQLLLLDADFFKVNFDLWILKARFYESLKTTWRGCGLWLVYFFAVKFLAWIFFQANYLSGCHCEIVVIYFQWSASLVSFHRPPGNWRHEYEAR